MKPSTAEQMAATSPGNADTDADAEDNDNGNGNDNDNDNGNNNNKTTAVIVIDEARKVEAPPWHQLGWRVLLAYLVLYVVWGSTYLAMKITVAGIPGMAAASMRFFFSGLLLFAWGRFRHRAPLQRVHVVTSILQGFLLLVCGNAVVMLALKTVPSGVGALILAVSPVFMALLGGDRRLSTWTGIVVGLVGIAILVNPWGGTASVSPLGALVLVGAALAWAGGSLLPRFRPAHPDNATSSGIQMMAGAVIQACIAVAIGEPVDLVNAPSSSLWALLYLAVVGSLVGFTTYGWLLRVEPPARVATHSYVNPVVAVILGAIVGGEMLSERVVAAAVVIVAAVVIIVRGRFTTPKA